MAPAITRIILLLAAILLVISPAAAIEPSYGGIAFVYYDGTVVDTTFIYDIFEFRFVLGTTNVPEGDMIEVQLRNEDGQIYRNVSLSRGSGGVYESDFGAWFVTANEYGDTDRQMYRWKNLASGAVGTWRYVNVFPMRAYAPNITDPTWTVTGIGKQITADFYITWPTPALNVKLEWLPMYGNPYVSEMAASATGKQHFIQRSGTVLYGDTPGWLQVTATNADGAYSRITRPYPDTKPVPTAPPTAPPTDVPTTIVPTDVPTTIVPTDVPTLPTAIPTGILTYPTPVPPAPLPTVTPVPVGTIPYAGIPTWSEGFRLVSAPLPAHTWSLGAPVPYPSYVDVPQWRNISVPQWLRNPVPVVGPAAGAAAVWDNWVDSAISTISAPVDAVVTPLVSWIAQRAGGIGDMIAALTTWVGGIAYYLHGIGDCLWVLIPLPVWVAAAVVVWWRLLQLVLAFLSSEQYTWLFEVRH